MVRPLPKLGEDVLVYKLKHLLHIRWCVLAVLQGQHSLCTSHQPYLWQPGRSNMCMQAHSRGAMFLLFKRAIPRKHTVSKT